MKFSYSLRTSAPQHTADSLRRNSKTSNSLVTPITQRLALVLVTLLMFLTPLAAAGNESGILSTFITELSHQPSEIKQVATTLIESNAPGCKFVEALAANAPIAPAARIRVSSFSTILTEISEQVGGSQVVVTGHVKPGVDPHEFEPKPADLKIVANSQLILLTAKHMEGYVNKLKERTGTQGTVVEVGNGFASLKMKSENDPGKSIEDPHWWHSVGNVEKATRIVRDELTKVDPADKDAFAVNANRYLEKLAALEKWARLRVAELPRDKRKLVTSHDAFQYFARDFGFTIYAIEGVSTEDQPSSKKVADLIGEIKAQGVKAIFLESIENPKVLKEITRETGAKVGGTLYADGLGEGEASTYEGMFKHNVNTIVDALK